MVAALYSSAAVAAGEAIIWAMTLVAREGSLSRADLLLTSTFRVAAPLAAVWLLATLTLTAITTLMAVILLLSEELIKLLAARAGRRWNSRFCFALVGSFAGWELIIAKATIPWLAGADTLQMLSKYLLPYLLLTLSPAIMHLVTAVIYSAPGGSLILRFMFAVVLHLGYNQSRDLFFPALDPVDLAYLLLDVVGLSVLLGVSLLYLRRVRRVEPEVKTR